MPTSIIQSNKCGRVVGCLWGMTAHRSQMTQGLKTVGKERAKEMTPQELESVPMTVKSE